ncbi:hypothetical protein [Nocardioides limicola]|uniref:hypothetical protein n=1 Tax=Nocardioides limicola TaxID=2803368 RepID=UPI00193BD2EA|nr:hypothetical protein [Nocardioides sp. DJM-14]
MLAVAAFVLVVAGCDLMRAGSDHTTGSRRLAIDLLGVLGFAFLALLLDLRGAALLGLVLVWVVAFGIWVHASAAALTRSSAVARALAFVALGTGIALSVVCDSLRGDDMAATAAQTEGLATGLVLAAAVLLQLSTANIVVRLILDAVGVPATTGEKQLKGGRVLGPMERLFLVTLGGLGHLTAAVVVVAAKGLLRFPELQRGAAEPGPSDVTEYFLIGSFASWLVGLAGVVMIAFGA